MKYKKNLGQHILNDVNVAQKMVETADIKKSDDILEIGPGTGFVTKYLLNKANKVIAVEFDADMIKILERRFKREVKEKRLIIIQKDVLNFIDNGINIFKKKYKVVSSLPYNIGNIIIRKLLESNNKPILMSLLVQLEVGKRICGIGKKRSILTNSIEFYCQADFIEMVPENKFIPPPKVKSSIIKLSNNKKVDKSFIKYFFRVLKIGFSRPRKKLINNLKAGFFDISEKCIYNYFKSLNISVNVRAENLTLNNWIDLTKKFFKIKK